MTRFDLGVIGTGLLVLLVLSVWGWPFPSSRARPSMRPLEPSQWTYERIESYDSNMGRLRHASGVVIEFDHWFMAGDWTAFTKEPERTVTTHCTVGIGTLKSATILDHEGKRRFVVHLKPWRAQHALLENENYGARESTTFPTEDAFVDFMVANLTEIRNALGLP